MQNIKLGRDFITMIRPMLGISQKRIRKITITAAFDSVVVCDVECLGSDDAEVDIADVTTDGDINRKFILEVREIENAS